MEMGLYLIIFLFIYFIVGVPIAFAIGLTVFTTVAVWGEIPFTIIFQQFYQGVDSFTLLAIPLFMFAGDLMLQAGIIDDILDFCNILVGKLRGGLAHVNVVASMLFAGLSGSAVSDTAAIGSILIPSMEKNGYDTDFSVAITSASSVIAPIIPPSIGMVLYGSMIPVSIGAMFAGGIIPGILLGLGLMMVVAIISKRRNYPVSHKKYSVQEIRSIFIKAIPALLMPMIILGGILFGIFTPTEAAAVACIYGLLIGFFLYKTLNFKNVSQSIINSMLTAASVLLIVAAAHPLGWLIAMAHIPDKIVSLITSITTNPLLVLLLINIFLLILGSIMECTANILIFAPILAPLAAAVGIDPLHFGVIFILNLTIGLATPPFGMCLFVGAGIGKISLERVMKAILPFIAIEIIVLLLATYVPGIVTTVPKLLGLVK